jgi:signal transduction histidine kinase
MERYMELLKANEEQINVRAAYILIYELCIITVILLLNGFKVFTLYSYATAPIWKISLGLLLIMPAILVCFIGLKGLWIKYFIITCCVLASGMSFIIFNTQAILIFIFPTVLVTLYYNSKLTYFTFVLTVIITLASHFTASYLLLPIPYQTSFGLQYVIIDTALPQVMFYLCFTLVIHMLNKRTLQLINNVQKITQENEMLELQKETAELRGRMDEREKISRDIHNSVGHTITAAIFALEAADVLRPSNPDAADEKTQRAIQRMRESMDIIRSNVRMLDKSNVLTVLDLKKALTVCCRQIELDSEVYVQIDFSGLNENVLQFPIHAERVSFLYGAVQECITNGMKHGGAKHIKVRLFAENEMLTMEIWNDGAAPETSNNKGFGLRKIKNYVENSSGNLSFRSGNGFTVIIELPMGGFE